MVRFANLEDALPKINTEEEIEMAGSAQIGDEGVWKICQALSQSTTTKLAELSLQTNNIGHDGARHLGETLKQNQTLTRLKLTNNPIGSAGVHYICEGLKQNKTLTRIDLNSNSIDDEGAKYLGEALEQNTTLTRLFLSRNSIGAKGAKCLGEALQRNTTLIQLYVSWNQFVDAGAKEICEALKKNTTLLQLHMAANGIGHDGAFYFIEALKQNKTLTQLEIKSNKFGFDGAKHLGEALNQNKTLTQLDFSYTEIGDKGVQHLCKALKKNKALAEVILSSIDIGVEGAQYCGEVLKQNTTLTKLDLSWNKIGDEGAKFVGEALKQNKTLTELYLGVNDIGAEGAKFVGEALKLNATLTQLNLLSNNINYEAAYYFGEALKHNKALTKLDLSSNKIGDEGAKFVGEALKQNKTLTELNLAENNIGVEGAKLLCEALSQNITLTQLNLQGNYIGDAGAKFVGEALKQNKVLTQLDVSYNNIGDDGAMYLAEVLKQNHTLTQLNLTSNNISIEPQKQINEILQHNLKSSGNTSKEQELFDAARDGKNDRIMELIKEDPKINLTWTDTPTGWTPLIIASAEGHIEVVKTLIQAGANINVKTEKDYHGFPARSTAIDVAKKNSKSDVVSYLESVQAMTSEPGSPAPQSPLPAATVTTTTTDGKKVNISEKAMRFENRIQKDKYDTDAWVGLLAEVQHRDIELARDVFERMLAIYPTAGRYWMVYAEMELKQGNYSRVKTIFERSLVKCLYVDLWKLYLSYVKKVNSDDSKEMTKAYEFALEHVGLDINSTSIWTDYLAFIKAQPARNTYEEQLQMDNLRRVYHRALAIPLHNIEELWKAYNKYENGLNPLVAKKQVSDRSPGYMTARTAIRERRMLMDNLKLSGLPRPPQGNDQDVQQLLHWIALIDWEKSNPLQSSSVTQRVIFTYQQCLMHLRFYPEIWHSACMYLNDIGRADDASKLYATAMQVLPSSLLLGFAYAEFEELRKNVDGARQIFETLLEACNKQIESITDKDKIQLEAAARAESLVYIMYMRFARRSDSVKSARVIFSRARKSPHCTYHVFLASALMEYHLSKETTIASKIFDLGLKSYGDASPAYVLDYLDYLAHLNEENNTRALFERSLSTLPSSAATEVWDRFIDFEANYGDLASVRKIEQRKREVYGKTDFSSLMKGLVDRYCFKGLLPCSQREIDFYNRGANLSGTDKKPYNLTLTLPPSVSASSVSEPASASVPSNPREVLTVTIGGMNVQARKSALIATPIIAPSSIPRPNLDRLQRYTPEPAHENNDPIGLVLSQLPPPSAYTGPLFPVDEVLDILASTFIPPAQSPSYGRLSMEGAQPVAIRASPSALPPQPTQSQQYVGPLKDARSGKRRSRHDEDDEAPVTSNRPPTNDVFRARRQKKS